MNGRGSSTSCPYKICGKAVVNDHNGYGISGNGESDDVRQGVQGQDATFQDDGGLFVDAASKMFSDMPASGADLNSVHEDADQLLSGVYHSSLHNASDGVGLYNNTLYNSLYNESLFNASAYNTSTNASTAVLPGESLILSTEAKVGLILLYSLTTLLAISGNVLVVLVFTRGRRSRTDIRPFLINLAVADLIMALFCMPFTFTFVMLKSWVFSKPMCPVVLFMQHLSVSASVFTNMAIGSDRFLVVMFPLRSRATTVRSRYVIIIIWICAVALSSVQLVVGRAIEHPDGLGGVMVTCDEVWSSHGARRTFTLFVLFITYIIPLIILAVAYSIVGILLWTRTTPGNAHEGRDLQQLQAKRKVVKMLVLVVLMFGLCWLPLHTFILVLDFNPELMQYESLSEERFFTALYYSVHWLAMSNSFVNPIIYSFSNDSFRTDLACLLYVGFPFCKCLKKIADRRLNVSTAETNIRNRLSTVRRYTHRDRESTRNNALRATHPPHKLGVLRNGGRSYFDLKRGASDRVERTRLCESDMNGSGRPVRSRLRGIRCEDVNKPDGDKQHNHEESKIRENHRLHDSGDSEKTEKGRYFESGSLGTPKTRFSRSDELDTLLEHDETEVTDKTELFDNSVVVSNTKAENYELSETGVKGKFRLYSSDEMDKMEKARLLEHDETTEAVSEKSVTDRLPKDSASPFQSGASVSVLRDSDSHLQSGTTDSAESPRLLQHENSDITNTDRLHNACRFQSGTTDKEENPRPLQHENSHITNTDVPCGNNETHNSSFVTHCAEENKSSHNGRINELEMRETSHMNGGGESECRENGRLLAMDLLKGDVKRDAGMTETTSLCDMKYDNASTKDNCLAKTCKHSSFENCVHGTGV